MRHLEEAFPEPVGVPNVPSARLEEVFGVDNPAFSAYIETRVANHPYEFRRLAAGMAQDAHPLARYAAGCALMEVAVGARKSWVTLRHREEDLEQAGALWGDAERQFASLQAEGPPDDKMTTQYMAMSVKARLAQANLPTLGIIARNRAGSSYTDHEIAERLATTKEQLLAIGADITVAGKNKSFIKNIKKGLVAEIVGQILLQAHQPLIHLIFRAPLRQEHHLSSTVRSNLIAIRSQSPHLKTLVRVAAYHKLSEEEDRRMQVVPLRDMRMHRANSIHGTLLALIDQQQGRATADTALQLDDMTSRLAARLKIEDAKRQR